MICPWDCKLCCTNAIHIKKEKNLIISSEAGMNANQEIHFTEAFITRFPEIKPTIFDLSLLHRQSLGLEPSFQEKLTILDNLPHDSKIDFAGGDPLSCYENFLIVKEAAKKFGKENISITSTGHSLSRYGIEELSKHIGEFEFTYDEVQSKNSVRPKGYNTSNILIAKKFSSYGIKTKAQIPINLNNIDPLSIKTIYSELENCNIDEILLMRTFPVGRSSVSIPNKDISSDDILRIINSYRESEKNGKTRVRLQCSLKHLENSEESNPCDLMQDSFGINFQGKLLISAWGNGKSGLPISEDFVLGCIINERFSEISNSEKFRNYKEKLDENWGHCKVFSYIFGGKTQKALFTKSDPLYSPEKHNGAPI